MFVIEIKSSPLKMWTYGVLPFVLKMGEVRSAYQELIVKFKELKELAYKVDGYLYRKFDNDLEILTENMLITGFFTVQIYFILLKLENNKSSLSNSEITENFKAYDEKIQSLDLLIKYKINHDWSAIFIKN